ncbi:hypothetical protein VPH35_094068 [Triticum aestivum]
MAAADGDERRRKRARRGKTIMPRRWSSAFPDDLLAVVYGMVASPRGRARFAAVCRSWRAASRAAPPAAALPWLLLEPYDCSRTKHLHIPEDGAIVRLRLPKRCSRQLVGCHDGGWVISTAPLKIVNLFSGAKVALPKEWWVVFSESKIVFSKSPVSDDCILAAMTEDHGIVLCRVNCPNSVWTRQRYESRMAMDDITFCNGELYGVTKYEGEAIKFEIGVNEDGAPMVTAEIRLSCSFLMDYIGATTSYIFVLRGKLAMAMRSLWSRDHEPFFKVFELIDVHGDGPAVSYKHKWMEVTSLDDHALFLGRTFSKAVRLPADKGGHVERNHIYYSCCLNQNDIVAGDALRTFSKDFSNQTYYRGDDEKEDKGSDDVKRIKSTGYFVKSSPYGSTWILPPVM